MSKLIDLIVPVYGKDPILTFNNLKDLTRIISDEVGIIIVYKNSKTLNYDSLKNLKCDNVKVIKAPSKALKTQKLTIGIENSNAYWVLPVDSHHKIIKNNFYLALTDLRNYKEKSVDLVWMMFDAFDLDLNRKVNPWPIGPRKVSNAGTQVLRREKINLDLIDFDIIFYDDFLWGMLLAFEKKLKVKKIENNFYMRIRGTKISTTFGKKTFEDYDRLNEHLDILLFKLLDLAKIAVPKKLNKEFNYSLYFLFRMKINNVLSSWEISHKDISKYDVETIIQIYRKIFGDTFFEERLKTVIDIFKYGKRINFKRGYWGYWPNKLNRKVYQYIKKNNNLLDSKK